MTMAQLQPNEEGMDKAHPGKHCRLTSAQRYMLILLDQDNELIVRNGLNVYRKTGSAVGFLASARGLISRGLARYTPSMTALRITAEGIELARMLGQGQP